MKQIIGENGKYKIYNWTEATEWCRQERGELKGYDWHVLMIYEGKILDKILLMDSATNEPIHEFNATALDAIAAEIDMVKMSIQFK